MSKLPVAEQFYSIQGEGPYAGTPSVFLRLAGCNFSCGWNDDLDEFEPGDDPQGNATWVCDTIDVWRDPERVYEPEELVEEWDERGWTEKFPTQDAHLILTGGEPMLHQQALTDLFYEINRGGRPFVEVETNGTQRPDSLYAVADHFNVSLKLSNSGHTREERLDHDVIREFVQMGTPGVYDPPTAIFKFVVAEANDVEEIEDIASSYGIPHRQITLMPAGASQEELSETYPLVAELCKRRGYAFSPRLQIDVWDMATGV